MKNQIKPQDMLPETALQIAAQYKQPPIAGCPVFMLSDEWQQIVLVKSGYAGIANTPAELEALLDGDNPASIIIPMDAAITNASLEAVLSRNSATKTILWGPKVG